MPACRSGIPARRHGIRPFKNDLLVMMYHGSFHIAKVNTVLVAINPLE